MVNPAALLLAWHLASSATMETALLRATESPVTAYNCAQAVRKCPWTWLRKGKSGASQPPLAAAPAVESLWLARKV